MPPKTAKHPCLACGQNVTSNSIACSVCNRWSHLNCSGLDQAVLKYFQAQQEDAGTHSWSCKGCNIAYVALNTRIRQVEKKQQELEESVRKLETGSAATEDRVSTLEDNLRHLSERTKHDKDSIIAAAARHMSMEQREREARKGNVVVYGLPEPPYEIKDGNRRQDMDKNVVGDMFEAIGADIRNDDVKFSARIGKMTEAIANKPRPLKLSFRNQNAKEHLFDKARNLPKTAFNEISISPDLTDQQRKEDKELMDETNRLNETNDDLNFAYRCVGRKGERVIIKTKQPSNNHQQRQSRPSSAAAARLNQPIRTGPVVPQPRGAQPDPNQPANSQSRQTRQLTAQINADEDTTTEKRGRESSEEPDDNNQSPDKRPSTAKKSKNQTTP